MMDDNNSVTMKIKKQEASDDEDEKEDFKGGGGGGGLMKQCKFCQFSSLNVRDLRKHKKEHHPDKLDKFHCDLCNYQTFFKDGLTQHKKYHDAPDHWTKIKCEHCDYIYAYDPEQCKPRRAQQQLNTHLNEEHANLKLKCNNCDKTFSPSSQSSSSAK